MQFQQGLRRGRVVEQDRSRSVGSEKTLITGRRRNHSHRRTMGAQHLDLAVRGFLRPLLVSHLKPYADATGRIANNQ